MKTQLDKEVIQEMAIEQLLEYVSESLHEFWAAHDDSSDDEEDRLPLDIRNGIDKAILDRARAELQRKDVE